MAANNNIETINVLSASIDALEQRLQKAVNAEAEARLSMTERPQHQSEISVSVGKVRVCVTSMRNGYWDHKVIRGREMLCLGVLKVLSAEVDVIKDELAQRRKELSAAAAELAHQGEGNE